MKSILFTVSGLIAAFLCSLAGPSVQAQDTLTRRELPKPLGVIKFAPLSLFDLDNTVQFGFEYPLKRKWTIQAEAGYGNHYLNLYHHTNDTDYYRNRETWRMRSEIRLYLSRRRTTPWGWYIAPEFFYKRINFTEQGSIGRECEDGICAYFERARYKILKDVIGYHFKIGVQHLVGRRITLDWYYGLGARHIYIKSPSFGPNDSTGENWGFITVNPGRPGTYRLVSMALGLKIGYLIYRKNTP